MKPVFKSVLITLSAALLLIGALFYGRFYSSSVCAQCGASQFQTEWQVPLTTVTLFRTNHSEETTLSKAIIEAKLVLPQHEHEWWFTQGGGNGVTCALGRGHGVFQAVHDSRIPLLILAANRHHQAEFARRIVTCLFNPDTSDGVRTIASMAASKEFSDDAQFAKWLSESSQLIETYLAPQ